MGLHVFELRATVTVYMKYMKINRSVPFNLTFNQTEVKNGSFFHFCFSSRKKNNKKKLKLLNFEVLINLDHIVISKGLLLTS